MIDRRTFCASLGAAAFLAALGPARALAASNAPPRMLMWHAPGCGCCLEWLKRVEAQFGGAMRIVETGDMMAVKRARAVPEALMSCHTALVGNVVVEGHVPPADIARLIASPRRGIVGLAVPGMPLGSPGMDVGHDRREAYQVVAFGPAGQSVFARHG